MGDRSTGYLLDEVQRAAWGGKGVTADLARVLDVRSMQIRDWRREHDSVPAGAWTDMLRLLRKRRAEIEQAERELIAEMPDIVEMIKADEAES